MQLHYVAYGMVVCSRCYQLGDLLLFFQLVAMTTQHWLVCSKLWINSWNIYCRYVQYVDYFPRMIAAHT